ncbi:hypothetical protein EBR56_04705, partial [bacterium]|nr:hypothetical protein [bacterium]
MIACRPACIRPCHAVATVAVCVAAFAFTAPARAQAPPNRGGGLLPTREKPTISGGPNRDEILRRFDLDSDGKIDEAEADAARARMRRDKIEGMSNSGIDPLTGRPRNAGVAGEPAAEPATD